MSPDELKRLAINDHMAGNMLAAEKGYKIFIETGIDDPDVLSNLALICQERGNLNKAQKLYERCVELFPNHSFSRVNLGFLYFTLGEILQGEKIIRQAILLEPNLANAHSILGIILKEKGDLLESEVSIRKAIELKPDFVDAYINLALLLKSKGSLEEAEVQINKAIKLNPKSPEAHLNLGAILQDIGNLSKAESVTRKALELNPKLKDAHMNLASILRERGTPQEALRNVIKEINLSSERQAPYLLLNLLFKECQFSSLNKDELYNLCTTLLNREDIAHYDLYNLIDTLFDSKALLKIIDSTEELLFADKSVISIIEDKTFQKALQLLIFISIEWEKIFTKIRRILLCEIVSDGSKLNFDLVDFASSLAQQCFLNEYIYEYTDEELDLIQGLRNKCIFEEIDELTVAVICCYLPMSELIDDLPQLIEFTSKAESFNQLISFQLKEPLEENEIALSLCKIGMIKDKTSCDVKTQYEQNPYPRWRFTNYLCENYLSLSSAINNEIRPNRIGKVTTKSKCRVLIAGCGTGQQLFDANRYQNAEITAIDLSESSLAYAQRKVKQYGLVNIKLIQMDILDLSLLGQRFDLIECSGVLHHMKDPLKGLESLLQVLENDGFLKLGLYSELARREVVEARKIIYSNNEIVNDKEIRAFRKRVINRQFPAIKTLKNWPDFYSTSMCRDLCFHVMEHRYSITKLDEILNSYNLEFLGFLLKQEVKDQYIKRYPQDKTLTDLLNWNQFEQLHPDIFKSMYQFWVRPSL